MYHAGVVYCGPKGVLCRKHWAAGSVMAEEGTPVEIMARIEFESAGSVGVAEVEREAAEEELTTGTVMFT